MGEMIVVVLIAAETLINPAPCRMRVCKGSLLFVLEGTFCAVDIKRLRMPFAVAIRFDFSCEARTNAAQAAAAAAAKDVLDASAKAPRLTGKVEIMLPPGADTAGLRNRSIDGP